MPTQTPPPVDPVFVNHWQPPSTYPDSHVLVPKDPSLARALATYQELERQLIELDARLEGCGEAVRYLGSSAAFVASTYDLRDSRRPFVPITRYKAQKHLYTVDDPKDFVPFSGYPLSGIIGALEAMATDLDNFLSVALQLTAFANDSVKIALERLGSYVNFCRFDLGDVVAHDDSKAVRLEVITRTGILIDHIRHLTEVLGAFERNAIPTMRYLQKEASDALQNQSTVATFLSAVTASTIQFSYQSSTTRLDIAVNLLWLVSLTMSLASAISSQLAFRWNTATYHDPSSKFSRWISHWITRIPLACLAISVFAFSAGLACFTFSVFPHSVIPPMIVCISGLSSIILGSIAIWLALEERVQLIHASLSKRVSTVNRAIRTTLRVWKERVAASSFVSFRHSFDLPLANHRANHDSHPVQESRAEIRLDQIRPSLERRRAFMQSVPRLEITRDIGNEDFDHLYTKFTEVSSLLTDAKEILHKFSPDGSYLGALCTYGKYDEKKLVLWTMTGMKFDVVRKISLPLHIGDFSWSPDSQCVALYGLNRDDPGFMAIKHGTKWQVQPFDYHGQFRCWMPRGQAMLSTVLRGSDRSGFQNDLRIVSIKEEVKYVPLIDILVDGLRRVIDVWVTRDEERLVIATYGTATPDLTELHVLNLATRAVECRVGLSNVPYRLTWSNDRLLLVSLELRTPSRLLQVDHGNKIGEAKLVPVCVFPTSESSIAPTFSFFGGIDEPFVACVIHTNSRMNILVWHIATSSLIFSVPAPQLPTVSWSMSTGPDLENLVCFWIVQEESGIRSIRILGIPQGKEHSVTADSSSISVRLELEQPEIKEPDELEIEEPKDNGDHYSIMSVYLDSPIGHREKLLGWRAGWREDVDEGISPLAVTGPGMEEDFNADSRIAGEPPSHELLRPRVIRASSYP